MRSLIKTVEGGKSATVRIAAGRHLVVSDFAGIISFAVDSDGPWGQLIELRPFDATEIATCEGLVEIENLDQTAGQISLGKI